MNSHDILMILVFTFPLFLLTMNPGIVASGVFKKNCTIAENKKQTLIKGWYE